MRGKLYSMLTILSNRANITVTSDCTHTLKLTL